MFENHLAWPYRLRSVAVALDGEPQYLRVGEIPSRVPIAAYANLPTGEHTVTVRLVAAYSGGMLSDGCEVTLRGARTFVIGGQPALVTLDVHTGGVTSDFVQRVSLAVRGQGVHRSPWIEANPPVIRRRPPKAEAPDCANVDVLDAPICKARSMLESARQDKDVIRVNCYNDKLVQMIVLRRMIDERQRNRDRLDAHEEMVVRIAGQRMQALSQELDACICEYPAFFEEPVELFADRPWCSGRDGVLPGETAW